MELLSLCCAVNTSGRESSSSNTNSNNSKRKPCGACKERRRRCDNSCVFADVIHHNERHKYKALCEMYNIKWVEEGLYQLPDPLTGRYFVNCLLNEDDDNFDHRVAKIYLRGVIGCGTKRRPEPCGVCKEKKRECKSSCVFAGAISYQEPEKYHKLNKVFNFKRIEEVLLPLNDDQRVEVVNLFLSEADRLNEHLHSLSLSLSPGCENHIRQGVASPPQDVGQQDLGPKDNLLPLSPQNQFVSWAQVIDFLECD